MMNVCLLGATGSIGSQTLDLINEFNKDYRLIAFSFGSNISKAIEIIEEFKPLLVSCKSELDCNILQSKYPNISFCFGSDGLKKVATFECDNPVVINALVGSIGIIPTYYGILSKRDIYLANKESLVIGGDLISPLAKKMNVSIYPIDSEHSAIFQLLNDNNKKDVKRLIITASGGSFRDRNRSELVNVTKEEALSHPNWKMGEHITIDSSTMMNKGYEVIEAHHLFDVKYDNISVVLHKESIIHSMVEFNDYSIFAQLASSDMHLPIKYALMRNHEYSSNIKPLDIYRLSQLNFDKVDTTRYPLFKQAVHSGEKGGYYPTILNASNEIAVSLFLEGIITYLQIEDIVIESLNNKQYHIYNNDELTIEKILELDSFIKNDIMNKYKEKKGN